MLAQLSLDLLEDLASSASSLASVGQVDAADVFAKHTQAVVGVVTSTITHAYGHLK